MERIFTELSNPVWWFSVVIAGIAINVFSSYLRGALDKFLSKSLGWWKNKSVARKEAWEEQINKLASSSEERDDAVADEIRDRFKSIFLLLSSIAFFCCSCVTNLVFPSILADLFQIIFLVFAAFFSFSGFLAWKLAEYTEAELKEAKHRMLKQPVKEYVDA